MSHILVLDQGTHASRAIVFSAHGDIIEQTQREVELHQISHQEIEQDANELLNSLIDCINRLNKNTVKNITRSCLTTQRSTTLAWDNASGKALGSAISWQDRRCEYDLEKFKDQQKLIKKITGLPLSAHYGSGKIRWIINHNTLAKESMNNGRCIISPLVSFLLFNLLKNKPCLIDHSNAHRSLLFDLKNLNWSEKLLSIFNIQKKALPTCKPVIFDYGNLAINNIPVVSVCGDQSAAFFSQGKVDNHTAIINIGTGAFILTPCEKIITHSPLLCGIAYSNADSQIYLLEGTVNGAGAALSWAQEKFPIDNLFTVLPEWLQKITEPPIFINTVGGLGSPWWRSSTDAHFLNDHNLHTAERYVAIIESIAFLILHNLHYIQQHITLKNIKISGGLSQLDGLCQKISDLSQLPVESIIETEATARGAAWLAAGMPEHWSSDHPNKKFRPVDNSGLKVRFKRFTEALKNT